MASQLDVMNELVARMVAATESLSAAGCPRMVIKGWPSRNQLDKGMDCEHSIISVYLPPFSERNVTRYPAIPQAVDEDPDRDLFVDAAGTDCEEQKVFADGTPVAFVFGSESGTPVAGETATVIFVRNNISGNLAFSYKVVAGNTVDDVVADLVSQINAAAIPGVTASQVSGVDLVITLVSGGDANPCENLQVRIGGPIKTIMEVKRQIRKFWINLWAASASIRDKFVEAIDQDVGLFLDEETNQENRIPLPDGTCATAYYAGSWPNDDEQQHKVWRQTFELNIEYPTVICEETTSTEVVAFNTDVTILNPNEGTDELPLPSNDPRLVGIWCVNQNVLDQLAEISCRPKPC